MGHGPGAAGQWGCCVDARLGQRQGDRQAGKKGLNGLGRLQSPERRDGGRSPLPPRSERVWSEGAGKGADPKAAGSQPGSWSLSPERVAAGKRSRPDRGLCGGAGVEGRAGPGQGSRPPEGSPTVLGVSAREGSRPAPRVVSPALTGARRLGGGSAGRGSRGPGGPRPSPRSSWSPSCPASGRSAQSPPPGPSPPHGQRPQRPPRQPQPPGPHAGPGRRRLPHPPQPTQPCRGAGDPPFKPPAPAPAALRPGTRSSRAPRLARSLRALDHNSQKPHGRARLLGSCSPDAGRRRGPMAPKDSQSHNPRRGPDGPGRVVESGRACWLRRGSRVVPSDSPPWSGQGVRPRGPGKAPSSASHLSTLSPPPTPSAVAGRPDPDSRALEPRRAGDALRALARIGASGLGWSSWRWEAAGAGCRFRKRPGLGLQRCRGTPSGCKAKAPASGASFWCESRLSLGTNH